jgi:predicted  nucleic acid-binding Zn-ribbon protein
MLRMRHLLLNVNTDKGPFGAKQGFGDGLNIIRAQNYAGKSQLLQAIIYALGLEGMFGPSHVVPLAHALTDYLDYKEGKSTAKATIIDSMVSLEIENAKGEFLTVQRAIAGDRHKHLVTVYEGRAVTRKEALASRRDYFVREPHATTSDRGFHRRLTEFLGWDLPMAPRFNDVDCPLYLETIFPLIFIEQKLAWGRIPARYPTWLGIRDVGRRTVEFLLGLDAYATAIERAAVQEAIARLRREWTSTRAQAEKVPSSVTGMVRGIPRDPLASWPPEVPPTLTVLQRSEWVPLSAHLAALRKRLAELEAAVVPSAQEAAPRVRAELTQAEEQLSEREGLIRALLNKFEADTGEAESLKQQIDAIKDDLRKYKDVRKIRKLGSQDEPEAAKGHCPTCHQELADSLLDTGKRAVPMSVEQNISFYEEQIKLFSAVYANAQHSIEFSEKQIQGQREEVNALRERIRAIRETLVSPANTPSIETVTERIRLEQRVSVLEGLQASFDDAMSDLAQLASEWKNVQERQARLPKGALSQRDEQKLGALQNSFRRQLWLYKMGSVDVSELKISQGNYEPEIAGLNLGADVAASDLIRLQWAYLLGLLEIGTQLSGNHPGLLIMDEPLQQSVEEEDFLAMLDHASKLEKSQIIIATSHERATIGAHLKKIGVKNVFEYSDNRILERL